MNAILKKNDNMQRSMLQLYLRSKGTDMQVHYTNSLTSGIPRTVHSSEP